MNRATTVLTLRLLNHLLPQEQQLLSIQHEGSARSAYKLSSKAGNFLDIVCFIHIEIICHYSS